MVFINWVDNVNRPLQRVSKDKVSGVSPTSEPMGQRSKDGLTLEMAVIFIIITDQLIGFCHDQMKKNNHAVLQSSIYAIKETNF